MVITSNISSAVSDFWQARRRAGLEGLMSRLTGKSQDLLSYEDIRQKLHAKSMVQRGLHEIPLDAIVGSVGRYKDFSRTFLPLQDSDSERWARVKVAQTTEGTPPIEVYKIGDAYFVLDGNHRVSVARQLGNKTIEAYVTEVETKVPLSPNDEPDDIILKAEYATFLAQTKLDELRPDANLSVTAPGKYPQLLEHIEVHRHYMGVEQKREIPYSEAVTNWYDHVYLPVARLIREKGLLHSVPNRTDTDLYLWLMRHRAEIEAYLGWGVAAEEAALDLMERIDSAEPGFAVSNILQAVVPATPKRDPARREITRREWQLDRLRAVREGRLASVILLPVRYEDVDWHALDQAIVVAQREGSLIKGLYAVPTEDEVDSLPVQALRDAFKYRCDVAGVRGDLIVEVGDLDEITYARGRWVDMVILRMPSSQVSSGTRGLAGFRTLLSRMPSPLLIVPGDMSRLTHALVAYNGMETTAAALYAAAHLKQIWQIPITVLALPRVDGDVDAVLNQAQVYLSSHGLEATYLKGQPKVAPSIVEGAKMAGADLIIMGDDAYTQVLKEVAVPVLICR